MSCSVAGWGKDLIPMVLRIASTDFAVLLSD